MTVSEGEIRAQSLRCPQLLRTPGSLVREWQEGEVQERGRRCCSYDLRWRGSVHGRTVRVGTDFTKFIRSVCTYEARATRRSAGKTPGWTSFTGHSSVYEWEQHRGRRGAQFCSGIGETTSRKNTEAGQQGMRTREWVIQASSHQPGCQQDEILMLTRARWQLNQACQTEFWEVLEI